VRLHYQGRQDKDETLLVIFDSPGAQASFVDLLQKSGFAVTAA
jgi:hypothetical protein